MGSVELEGTGVWQGGDTKGRLVMLKTLNFCSFRAWMGSAEESAFWLETPKGLAGDNRDLELSFQLKAG